MCGHLPQYPIKLNTYAGNQALDSGLVGIGLGALGATVLAPAGDTFSIFGVMKLMLAAFCWK